MNKLIWIVRDGEGEYARIIGVGFRFREAMDHAELTYNRRNKTKGRVLPTVRSAWKPLRYRIDLDPAK